MLMPGMMLCVPFDMRFVKLKITDPEAGVVSGLRNVWVIVQLVKATA